MSELAGFAGASWLPASVQRRMAAEDGHERAEARRAEAKRADQAEAAREQSLAAYRAAAEQRGEVVSALAIASGEVTGRDLADVLGGAAVAGDRADARETARRRRESGEVVFIDEPVIHGASRSDGWPSSSYEADSMLRRARGLHSDLVRTMARHDYPATVAAARRHSATRSGHECAECKAVGATPEESFLIHADPAPETPPAVMSEDELEWHGRQTGQPYRPAERYGRGGYGMAVR